MPSSYPEITWQQYRAILLVDERGPITVASFTYELYLNQMARPRAEELLKDLEDLDLVHHIDDAQGVPEYYVSMFGKQYMKNAIKPTPPLR